MKNEPTPADLPAKRRSPTAGVPILAAFALMGCLLAGVGVVIFGLEQPWNSSVLLLAVAGAGAAAEPVLLWIGWARRPSSYRLSALVAGAAGCGLVLLSGGHGLAWQAVGVAAAACLGSALASWKHLGLTEDNYPPAPAARAAVEQAHQSHGGAAPRRSAPKRGFDVVLAMAALVLTSPLWLALMALIWLEEPGPVFFVKNSVGRGGRTFRQWKLRTMVHGAEDSSGPVLASEDDARALAVGRWLRKTALDELPQLVNILIGDMSFVGPRPQRTVLVLEYLESMPEYADRHQVRPGLAGLAQVAGDYYLTPRQKLRFDRLYVQHADLLFDLWLVTLACLVVFWWRWQPGWRGYLSAAQIRGRRRRSARSCA